METITGKCSIFGGPADLGMTLHEGLALVTSEQAAGALADYFLRPLDQSRGIGRQLNPLRFYCAMRWNYAFHGGVIATGKLRVVVRANGKFVLVRPVDWGPARWTGRIIDLSKGAAAALNVTTDDEVTVEIIS